MIRRKLLILPALLLTALFVMQLCGCAVAGQLKSCAPMSDIMDAVSADLFGEPEQEYTRITMTLPRHPGYAPIDDRHGLADLDSEDERAAYLSMEESLYRITAEEGGEHGAFQLGRALIPNLDSVQIFKVKEALRADHPEAFWFNGNYTLGRNAHDGLFVIMYSSLSAEKIATAAPAVADRVNRILRDIPSYLTEYDRELLIHDMLVRDVEYDHAAAENMDLVPEAATVYGALVDGRAVCTGYSFAVKLLLNRVGVSCMTVDGVIREEPDTGHMWNLVQVDDEWYHLDITNNDPTAYSVGNIRSYNYFNLTDRALSVTHEVAPNYSQLTESTVEWGEDAVNAYNFTLPKCESTKWNYYLRNAHEITQLNGEGQSQVLDILREQSRSGEDMFYLMFPDGMSSTVIEDWFTGFINSDINTVNGENIAAGSGYLIDQCSYAQGATVKWCNVYIFKLLFDGQPITK